MWRRLLLSGLVALLAAASFGAEVLSKTPASKVRVVVIPVREQIAPPVLYILRRGLKDAETQKADLVVLDMKTLGGASDTTFEIMEALDKFSGETVTFVDDEAGSAGALIAGATREIWFAPKGVIGAAAAVQSSGEEIPETMKLKINSFFGGKVRTYTTTRGRYRADVLRAMMEAKFEFKIGDKVIKPKDELLTLTADEAIKTYGEPPETIFGAGIAKSLDELLTKKFGASNYTVRRLEITWSEKFAVFLQSLQPILLGLGMLALFIEFKTPGFGVFGIVGIALLAVVFLTSYVAGLSGHEPLLFFGLGVLLVALELIFWHTAGFLGAAGIALMVASLLWTMADIWPNEPISVAWSGDVLLRPLGNLALGLVIAVGLFAALLRFLPKGWVWDRLVVQATSGGAAQIGGGAAEAAAGLAELIGKRGVAATALRPGGQVEIEGRRYEAKVEVGSVDPGAAIVVTGCSDFALTVEKANA